MSKDAVLPGLTAAVQRYFDLMYDADTANFHRVFAPTAQLHSVAKGEIALLTAKGYKEILEGRASPKSVGAPRHEEILLVDVASPDQALVKVRVRINKLVFVDYLTYHRTGGDWLVTSKGYHLESKVE